MGINLLIARHISAVLISSCNNVGLRFYLEYVLIYLCYTESLKKGPCQYYFLFACKGKCFFFNSIISHEKSNKDFTALVSYVIVKIV